MMPRGGWPYGAPGAGSQAPVRCETPLWNSHWVSHISSKTMQGAADKKLTSHKCLQTTLRTEHLSILYANNIVIIAIKAYGLPLTLSKLHSHGHLPWTSAKALAPSGPILLSPSSIVVSDLLTFSASDAMAQRLRR